MFLADASAKRPVAVTCLLIALIGLGLNEYRKMSLELIPQIDIPYVTITTAWVGASPTELETDVAKRIEDAVSGLDGLKHVQSLCTENLCNVFLEFNIDIDVDVAAVDVREKVDTILDDLPEGCQRPVIEKIDVNSQAVVILALTGEANIRDKYDYIDDVLGDKFSSLPGVASVTTVGGNEREVHVELDRDALIAAGLTSSDVVSALAQNIGTVPAGRVRYSGSEISVKYDGEYSKREDIANLEVANKEGIRRYIRDLGQVLDTTEEVRERAFYMDQPCVIMQVIKKGEGNTVKVVEAVKKRVEELKDSLPGGMKLNWIHDEGSNIEHSVDSTLEDIVSGIILCGIILLLFLGNIRTTLIICITMPVTIVISFFFMGLLNYSLNSATLLAIGLSVGVLVSNSIVVLENVVKRFNDIDNPWEAARIGTNEVAIAVIASAGTNVVVMLPIGMMHVLIGKIFGPFAVTTLIVNLVSLLVCFTLTPILCAVVIRKQDAKKLSILACFGQWWGNQLAALSRQYMRVMGWFADHRWASVLLVLATIAVFLHCFTFADKVGFTFFETEDHGTVFIKFEFPVDYDLDKTTARLAVIEKKLLGLSDLENYVMQTGKTDAIGGFSIKAVYYGQLQLKFKDKLHRDWKILDRIRDIADMLQDETDCIITVAVQSIMGGMSTPIELHLTGEDLNVLRESGKKLLDIVKHTPGVGTADSTVRDLKPQLVLTPNRAVLSDLHLPSNAVGNILRGNLEGIEAATFKSGARSFDIRVKYHEEPGKEQIGEYMVPGVNGDSVRMDAYGSVEEKYIPVDVRRQDKQRTVNVTGTTLSGAKLQEMLSQIVKQANDQNLIPAGYTLRVAGDGENMEETLTAFAEAAIIAVFLTYLTLSAILESFTKPLLIMITLPLGLIGVLWVLRLVGLPISAFAMLGILMLIGIVVNAAVVIFDRMMQIQATGVDGRQAMVQALGDTFRAVLMLVLASSLGMLPMAISNGIGSELRQGIGWASFGGVLVAGILTMTVLPLMYTIFTRKPKNS